MTWDKSSIICEYYSGCAAGRRRTCQMTNDLRTVTHNLYKCWNSISSVVAFKLVLYFAQYKSLSLDTDLRIREVLASNIEPIFVCADSGIFFVVLSHSRRCQNNTKHWANSSSSLSFPVLVSKIVLSFHTISSGALAAPVNRPYTKFTLNPLRESKHHFQSPTAHSVELQPSFYGAAVWSISCANPLVSGIMDKGRRARAIKTCSPGHESWRPVDAWLLFQAWASSPSQVPTQKSCSREY
jgi:hypothetical protein